MDSKLLKIILNIFFIISACILYIIAEFIKYCLLIIIYRKSSFLDCCCYMYIRPKKINPVVPVSRPTYNLPSDPIFFGWLRVNLATKWRLL